MSTASADETQRLQRLLEVGQSLVSELRLELVLDRVLETARELTGARYAAIGVLTEDRRELARFITRGIDEDKARAIGPLPRGRGVLGALIDDPRPLRLHDVVSDPRAYGFPPGHPPMATFLGVPVRIRDRVWGNLYLTEKDGGADFDDEDEESIVVLAGWAAIAIENARLYESLDARRLALERAVKGLEATSAVAEALGTETDLSRVLELIVNRARALVSARSVLVLLADGEDLVVAAAAGQVTSASDRLPTSESRCGDVLTAVAPLRIDDVESEPRLDSALLGVPDASAALLVPMTYRGRPLGVLCAFDRMESGPGFDPEDEQVLRSFAASAATAVAVARTVESDRLRAALASAEAERRRWARELHDETLQALGALKMHLAGAVRVNDPLTLRDSVAAASEQVTHDIENLRALISELRPAALDELGLGPALHTLAERLATTQGLDIEAVVDLDPAQPRPGPELETAVYRVAQEALTNVVKHAQATRVRLLVTRDGETMRLEVFDDGVGFDPDQPTSGLGLVGIRERVALTAGTLEVTRADPGMRLVASFPLDAA